MINKKIKFKNHDFVVRIERDMKEKELEKKRKQVEWLEQELFYKAVFMEHLTGKQQNELRDKIDKAFPDLQKKKEEGKIITKAVVLTKGLVHYILHGE